MGGTIPVLIEVCVASLEDALICQSAGAHRIELNQALELDGLTPSIGLIERTRESLDIPVIAMTRPRAGDFFYREDDWLTLLADADRMLDKGVEGVAFGALDGDRRIDVNRCRQMRRLAGAADLVFHKAFDDVPDPMVALEQLVDAGIDRVMTSGLAARAIEGTSVIRQLQDHAKGRIEVLPAGGISSQNVVEILSETRCTQIHGSFRNSAERDFRQELLKVHKLFQDIGTPL